MEVKNVEQGQNFIDWIVASDRIFVVLSLILFGVVLYALYKMLNIILKEREESKHERKEFLSTLNSQQQLISKQQDLLEDEKKIFEKMGSDISQINYKLNDALDSKGGK